MPNQTTHPKLRTYARELRKNLTPAERLVWNVLRNRSFHNLKFVRQFPIEPYIVDFCCRSRKLVIEIDGSAHSDQRHYDQTRTNFLKSKGYKVIRFKNHHIQEDVNNFVIALESILGFVSE